MGAYEKLSSRQASLDTGCTSTADKRGRTMRSGDVAGIIRPALPAEVDGPALDVREGVQDGDARLGRAALAEPRRLAGIHQVHARVPAGLAGRSHASVGWSEATRWRRQPFERAQANMGRGSPPASLV